MVHIGIYVYATQLIFDFYFGFTRKTESYANNSFTSHVSSIYNQDTAV